MAHQAILWDKRDDGTIKCRLCAHGCVIADGKRGICGVRENRKNVLITHAYGNPIAVNCDPIEKKPLYHFMPGTESFSIAEAGCNFRCDFCQNWSISQAKPGERYGTSTYYSPEEIVRSAKEYACKSISYTYTEPTIFFEYAYDIGMLARKDGIKNVFVTNGYMTRATIDKTSDFLDAANIDLKFMNDRTYEKYCGARLRPVLDTIKYMKEKGIWVEITTLVIPTLNDSGEELSEMAAFISGIDKNIPWHLSRYHPDYKFDKIGPTPVTTLKQAQVIGKMKGLKYVYLGNVPEDASTGCPDCGVKLIKRTGFAISKSGKFSSGKCQGCGGIIEGVWG